MCVCGGGGILSVPELWLSPCKSELGAEGGSKRSVWVCVWGGRGYRISVAVRLGLDYPWL